eukprot:scaffold14584_cov97-Cyclotella_meneghiniana.AAC.2
MAHGVVEVISPPLQLQQLQMLVEGRIIHSTPTHYEHIPLAKIQQWRLGTSRQANPEKLAIGTHE